jgi:heme-degrading monooxygenase HmoA
VSSHPIVTVFRSRLRPDAGDRGYHELAAEMESRARAMPGFVDFKSFSSPDGERVSLIVFDTRDHHDAWRDDAEHRAAQKRGRDEFYSEYSIQVCEEHARRRFNAPALAADGERP